MLSGSSNERVYEVLVPERLHAGDSFYCMVSGVSYRVMIPDGVKGGDTLAVSTGVERATGSGAVTSIDSTTYIGVPRSYFYDANSYYVSSDYPQPRASYYYTIFLLVIEVVCFGLLIAAYAQVWSEMIIDGSCNVVNWKTGTPVTRLYYDLFTGISSSFPCVNDDENFCIKWGNIPAWEAIDQLTLSNMEYDARYHWQSSFVLIPLASACVALAVMFHIGIWFCDRSSEGNNTTMALLISGGFLLWLTWIFALSGVNTVVYTTSMASIYWIRLFKTGISFENILQGQIIPTNTLTNTCDVTINFQPGCALAGAAITISFFVGIFLLLTCCCGGCFEDPYYVDEYYTRRPIVMIQRSQPLSQPLYAASKSEDTKENELETQTVPRPKYVIAVPVSNRNGNSSTNAISEEHVEA